MEDYVKAKQLKLEIDTLNNQIRVLEESIRRIGLDHTHAKTAFDKAKIIFDKSKIDMDKATADFDKIEKDLKMKHTEMTTLNGKREQIKREIEVVQKAITDATKK